MFLYLIQCLAIFAQINLFKQEKPYVYNLTSGLYEAEEVKVLGKPVHKLLGIPYANIPESFESTSIYNQSNESIKKANKFGPVCIQPVLFNHNMYGNFKLQQEYDIRLECLTINVFLPKIEKGQKPLTAMLFLHGGSNAAGTSSFIDGSALASVGNVVVAMPNYRLDVLGFLNVHSIKGNNGLWDSVVALEWLWSNCESLGCNKSEITLFGHSAGSSDTQLLTLSKYARKYINRAIMQSGSGLAHWAFAYEIHLFDEIKNFVKKNSLDLVKTKNLIDLVNYDKSKYINSLNDTFNNFIIFSTCNLTLKYECIKEKIKNYFHFNSQMLNSHKKMNNLLDFLDINEIISVFGHLHKNLLHVKNKREIKLLKKVDEPFKNLKRNSNEEALRKFQSFLTRNNHGRVFKSMDDYSKFQSNPCYADLMHFIWGSENLLIACDFISFYKSKQYFNEDPLIKYFLECFQNYYIDDGYSHLNGKSDLHEHIIDISLPQNTNLVINEMQLCLKQVSSLTQMIKRDKNENDTSNLSSSKINDIINENVANGLREMSFLTENSNFLHRPAFDNFFFEKVPHSHMNDLNEKTIDSMMGVTSHESFYFLLHDFNINHIIMHTFIYSSLLNLTDNLLFKLIRLNSNIELNVCLRKHLFNFYNFTMTDKDIRGNSLKNVYDSLELLSDYDFVLPMITQIRSEFEKSKYNVTNNILYVYEFSKLPSFNYLLNLMKNVYKPFEEAEKFHNKSIIPHYAELDSVFGLPILTESNLIKYKDNISLIFNYTKEEYDLSVLMINYWANFAKYGNPNLKDGPKWEKFSHTSPYVLRIDSSKPKSDKTLINKWFKVHKFWYEILTNAIYDECSAEYDTDFHGRKDYDNSNLLRDLVKNDLNFYQKLYLKSDSNTLNSSQKFVILILFSFIFPLNWTG